MDEETMDVIQKTDPAIVGDVAGTIREVVVLRNVSEEKARAYVREHRGAYHGTATYLIVRPHDPTRPAEKTKDYEFVDAVSEFEDVNDPMGPAKGWEDMEEDE